MKMVIYGGMVVDPANSLAGARDVLVEDGVIRAVDAPGSFAPSGKTDLDATGLIVAPGLIDKHEHLRDTGYE